MSNFTPLVRHEYEFEGDTVVVEFSRLKRKHMLGAMPALKKLQDSQGADKEDDLNEAINDVLNSIVDVIPEYVVKLEGLSDAEGHAVDIETVCSTFYFMKLIIQIAVGMLEASSGKEGKA